MIRDLFSSIAMLALLPFIFSFVAVASVGWHLGLTEPFLLTVLSLVGGIVLGAGLQALFRQQRFARSKKRR
jgi:hypothetical protein